MSTKLYDGLRLTEHAPDIFTVTRLISKRIRQVFEELAEEIVARQVQAIVDDQKTRHESLVSKVRVPTLIQAARQRWLDEQATLNNHLAGHDPLRFSIVFGEADNQAGTIRLAYPFMLKGKYRDALLELRTGVDHDRPLFTDYHYQNQTECPDGIDETEWEQRAAAWDQLLNCDDMTTDGTLGHLPGWQLPDTLDGVFGNWLRWNENLDLDQHCDPEARLRASLKSHLWHQLDLAGQIADLDPAARFSEIVRVDRGIRNAVNTVLERPETRRSPRPDPLPVDLWVSVADLPPVFTPAAELVDAALTVYHASVKET